MEIQLSMLILEVRDLARSIAFYRDLGLDVPDPVPGRPVAIHRMGSGVSLLLTTSFAATHDPAWTRPTAGYQQLLEFYVGEDAVVDQRWADLVAAGHPGRMPPTQTAGPYAAMVDDPDGNVVLLTSDEAARVDQRPPASATSQDV
jgi:predicted lactoylglutathione lyase